MRVLITLLILLAVVLPVSAQGLIVIPDNQNPIRPGGIHDVWPDQWPYHFNYNGFIYPCLPRFNPAQALENCVKPVNGYYPYPWMSPAPQVQPDHPQAQQHDNPTVSESNPTPQVLTYTVESGDNWYSIARKLGVDVESLWDINDIDDPNAHIHRGNVFIIP